MSLCWRLLILTLCLVFSRTASQQDDLELAKSAPKKILEIQEIQDAHVSSNMLDGHHHESSERYQVAKYDWRHVATPYTIAIWILLASFAKIAFNFSKKISAIFPDSALLIAVGLVVGVVLSAFFESISHYSLDSETFFLYLLPPIVFDAGYFMPNRAFFDNLGSILVFAVIGTIWNVFMIGISLWMISLTGLFSAATPLLHILLFTSLISAVDPVAVIVVFEEIHVNEILFITVFGESLLNDAVTVVLYQIFKSFSEIGANNLQLVDYAAGGISFFTVAFGGVLIGLIWAFIVSITTKFTKQVKILSPVFVFLMPYCAYLTAEMFGMSAIMAIVFCGIAMKQYVKLNISSKAVTSIKYFIKMLSGMSETIIFMFLGLSSVVPNHHWDIPFIAFTVVFCLVYRAIGVIIQSYFLNKYRLMPYSKVDQFVIAYGGLRGAIAFGLVVALPDTIPAKDLFVTATIVVIYFTVFLQGITIKPLVNWLQVELRDQRKKTMAEHIFEKQIDLLMGGLEDICGFRGHHWLRDTFDHFNSRWLRPILVKKKAVQIQGSKLVREFIRLKLKDAANVARGRAPSVIDVAPLPKFSHNEASEQNAYANPVFERTEMEENLSKEQQLDIDQIFVKKRDDASMTMNQDAINEERVKKMNQIGLQNIYYEMRKARVDCRRTSSLPMSTPRDSEENESKIHSQKPTTSDGKIALVVDERNGDGEKRSRSPLYSTISLPMPLEHPLRQEENNAN